MGMRVSRIWSKTAWLRDLPWHLMTSLILSVTGEYRQCFHPDLATHCDHCGLETLHTRQHILFDCPKYVSLAASMTDWKKDKNNDKSWKSPLQANTSAFSFGDLPDDVHWTLENFCNPVASCHLSASLLLFAYRSALALLVPYYGFMPHPPYMVLPYST